MVGTKKLQIWEKTYPTATDTDMCSRTSATIGTKDIGNSPPKTGQPPSFTCATRMVLKPQSKPKISWAETLDSMLSYLLKSSTTDTAWFCPNNLWSRFLLSQKLMSQEKSESLKTGSTPKVFRMYTLTISWLTWGMVVFFSKSLIT